MTEPEPDQLHAAAPATWGHAATGCGRMANRARDWTVPPIIALEAMASQLPKAARPVDELSEPVATDRGILAQLVSCFLAIRQP